MRLAVTLIICTFILTVPIEAEPEHPIQNTNQVNIEQSFGQLPFYFIENQGQLDDEVCYYIQGSDKALYFTPTGVTFSLTKRIVESSSMEMFDIGEPSSDQLSNCEYERWIVKLDFVDAKPVKPKAQDKQKTVFSYFKGKPEEWHAGCSTYVKLLYEDLWPGIDLVFSGTVNQLKYEFIVKPGADHKEIRLAYRGASNASIKDTGELKITTPVGDFEDGIPYAYQVVGGKPKEVSMNYALANDSNDGVFGYTFDLGIYDAKTTLILDPILLVYCGYIGGSSDDYAEDIAVDDSGNAYITGYTYSTELSFPVIVGPDLTYNGSGSGADAFVAKLNQSGLHLDYCGYIGGEGLDEGLGIAVDKMGNAYVTGLTDSTEATFPVTVGPDLTYNDSSSKKDAFVAKVNASGIDLEYCGYIGGEKYDQGSDIAIDSLANAYVTGSSSSTESTFPVKVGPYLTYSGNGDVFVAKVCSEGTHLDYCGYIGGEGSEWPGGIAVDSEGNTYVTGHTYSDENSFPVKVGPDLSYNGSVQPFFRHDAFVVKVNGSGAQLDYCGYIGGSEHDTGRAIVVDSEGNAFVAGETYSDENSFPVKVGPDLTQNGSSDAFVTKVIPSGLELDFCGYIGGDDPDLCYGIAVNSLGHAYVTGWTYSDETTFPVKDGPDLTFNGFADVFVARLDRSGTQLDFCGYIGGERGDLGKGLALDSLENIYITGDTYSDEASFPVKIGPDMTFNGIGYYGGDAFVAKLSMALAVDSHFLPEGGGSITFYLSADASNMNRNYLLLGSVSGTEPGHPLPGGLATLPLNFDYFTYYVVFPLLNTPVLLNFMGILDGNGQATAQLNSPALPPGYVGLILYFAYCCNNPFDFVSNPVEIGVVP